MNQIWENGKKPSFVPDFGPFCLNSGRQFFLSKIWLRQSLDIMVSYHHVQHQKKLMIQSWENLVTDGQTDKSDVIGRCRLMSKTWKLKVVDKWFSTLHSKTWILLYHPLKHVKIYFSLFLFHRFFLWSMYLQKYIFNSFQNQISNRKYLLKLFIRRSNVHEKNRSRERALNFYQMKNNFQKL